MDYFVTGIVFYQLVKISLRQILIYLFIRSELRNILEVVGRTTAKNYVFEILRTQFVLWHHSPQQIVIQKLRFSVQHMSIGVLPKMSNKSSMIPQLLKQ